MGSPWEIFAGQSEQTVLYFATMQPPLKPGLGVGSSSNFRTIHVPDPGTRGMGVGDSIWVELGVGSALPDGAAGSDIFGAS